MIIIVLRFENTPERCITLNGSEMKVRPTTHPWTVQRTHQRESEVCLHFKMYELSLFFTKTLKAGNFRRQQNVTC